MEQRKLRVIADNKITSLVILKVNYKIEGQKYEQKTFFKTAPKKLTRNFQTRNTASHHLRYNVTENGRGSRKPPVKIK